MAEDARLARRILLGIVLLPVLGVGGCTAALILTPKDATSSTEAAAIAQCRAAVRSQLKAPATAKFSSETFTAGKVVGYVDAQNSYGAQIRTRHICEGGKVTILQ